MPLNNPLGILGPASIGSDIKEFHDLGGAFEAVQNQAIFEMMTLNAVPPWLPLPRQLRFRRAQSTLADVVDTLISRHLVNSGPGTGGIVDRMLTSSTSREGNIDDRVRERIRDELVTMLLAGHETTASTLTWAFYLMDANPHVWDAVREEARNVLGDDLPSYDSLRSLNYTQQVLHEVIRLYPPVWLLPRKAIGPDTVGEYHVPPGGDVLICPYTLHRHPGFWEDSTVFSPERFAADSSNGRHRYAYVPFGAGPRSMPLSLS